MVIAVFAPHYAPAFLGGGPIRTLQAMIQRSQRPEDIFVLTSDRDLGQAVRLNVPAGRWQKLDGANIYYMSDDRPKDYLRGLFELRRSRPSIIYLNSVFNVKYSILPLLLARVGFWHRALLVLAPRGELSAGALALHGSRKWLFLHATRLMKLHDAIQWHASTDLEAREIDGLFRPSKQTLVNENESSLPPHALPPPLSSAEIPHIIYLSRISEKKGLHLLLSAMAKVTRPIALDIYGEANSPTYMERCRRLADAVPVHVTISFFGSIRPDCVRETFNKYDAFFFPTAGENFGHAIAESFSASCPVYLCDVTPWTARANAAGGVVDDLSDRSWAASIERFATNGPEARLLMRKQAALVYEDWQAAATRPSFIDMVFTCYEGDLSWLS